MALNYREFGVYFLCDLAESVSHPGADRMTLNGNQVSYHFIFPTRGERESQDEFAARVRNFRGDLPRGSDHPYRLAIAHEAFMRSGDNAFGAAFCLHEELKKLPTSSERSRRQWAKRGITHKLIESKIGSTRRGRRRKRKKPESVPDYRTIETIRCEVSRYKSRHANFAQAFENEFNLYRSIYCRDASLCAEEEAMYRELLGRCEIGLSPCHQLTATYTLNLARVLHEQGKFAEALPFYWLGLVRVWAARWVPHYREALLFLIFKDIENCQSGQPPAPVRSGHLRLHRITVDLPAGGKVSFRVDLRHLSLSAEGREGST